MMTHLPHSFSRITVCTLAILLLTGIFRQTAQAQCPVNAAFNHSSSYICQGASLTFNNTTTGGPIGQAWYENITLFSTSASPTRTFNTPGSYVISLVSTNGSCADTAMSAIVVSPTITGSLTPTNPTCSLGTNGSINLTPGGGTPNRSINNNRAISDYTAANSVTGAGFTGGITVEAWVKPRSTWLSGDGLFAAFNQTGGTGNRFFVGYNPGFQQFVYFDDNLGNQFFNGTQPRGNWYHIAVTISSGNTVNMYLNGTLNRTVNTNAGWIPMAGDLFNMGQEWDLGVLSQHFDGFIDEVRIWNAVLSPATILSNRNSCMGINNTHPNWGNIVAYYSMNEGSGTYVFDRSGNNRHGSRVNGSAYGTAAESNWGCFSAGTGYGYSWSTGAVTEDISSLSAGSYTVTVMDGAGAGCNLVTSTTLTNPSPVMVSVTPPGPVAICSGTSTTLTATGANTYGWSPGTGLSTTTGPVVVASPASTQTYTVIGTNAVGCIGQTTVQVVVNSLPTASITGNTVICLGDTSTLLASGGTGYNWSNGPTTAANPVSPASATLYTVTVTDANSCTDTAQVNVTVNSLPVVSISGDDSLCTGDSTTITASGGTGYAWSNGPTSAGQTVGPAITTLYTVTVTDANSCENTGSINVVVNALPVLSFSGTDTVCSGDTTQITVSGANTYIWNHGPTTAQVDLSPGVDTYYGVVGTDNNGCEAEDSIQIVVNSLPTVSIAGVDTLCEGDSTTLTASGASSYVWNTTATTASITVAPPSTLTYSVIGTDGNGCDGGASYEVVVNPLPNAAISGQDTICAGDSTTLTASGGGTYFWDTFSASQSISVAPTANTTYTVTVTSGAGCESSASVEVVVNALPTAAISGLDTICAGDTTTLTASGGGTYFWSTFSASQSISVSPGSNTTYTVTVTSGDGCEASASVQVVVNALPATPVITQNGNVLSTASGFAGYQWYFNGSAIPGATSDTYTASLDGDYTVVVTNAAGCSATSAPLAVIIIGVTGSGLTDFAVDVYPNPNRGQFTVRLGLERERNVSLRIFDLMGKQIWSHGGDLPYGEWKEALDLSGFAKGTYLLDVVSEGQRVTRKIVVE